MVLYTIFVLIVFLVQLLLLFLGNGTTLTLVLFLAVMEILLFWADFVIVPDFIGITIGVALLWLIL